MSNSRKQSTTRDRLYRMFSNAHVMWYVEIPTCRIRLIQTRDILDGGPEEHHLSVTVCQSHGGLKKVTRVHSFICSLIPHTVAGEQFSTDRKWWGAIQTSHQPPIDRPNSMNGKEYQSWPVSSLCRRDGILDPELVIVICQR